MLSAFTNSLKIPDLRRRILFTAGLIFFCRIICLVPVPGVDPVALTQVIHDLQERAGGGFLAFVDLFSGGAVEKCAIGTLGIMPYISASIILQLMTAVVPALERMAREGESGRQKLTQYTRYLTVIICIIQGVVFAVALENPEQVLGTTRPIVLVGGWGFRIMAVLTMTTATLLLMWLGEQITERGIGNGISLVITVNIVSRLPIAIMAAKSMFAGGGFAVFYLLGMVIMMFLVVAGTISITQAQRKVPIHTTKRIVGRKVYGGQSTYMPLRINYSGVMPIIFASIMLQFPGAILRRFKWTEQLGAMLQPGETLYLAAYAALIFFFSYFWVATQFNPLQIADNLKKNGGYVPGIRPGKPTADFLDRTMTRITLVGATFLTVIAVIPSVMAIQFNIDWIVASFFGGTSLLIMVGVALDTMRQVESQLLMRHYDGFLRKGKLRSRR